ncbi:MAG: trigger factor [Myxococcales bacterium]|nr:trigger factor [Myxococcales bacterium]
MKVDVQDISSVEKRLVVEVPAERVAEERSSLYRRYRARVKIRGFRPGKAPQDVIKRFYGEAIEREVVTNLVQDTLPLALRESGLNPVSEPDLDEFPNLDEGALAFSYAVRLEVKPELGVVNIDGLALEFPTVEVEEEQVEEELKYLRYQHSTFEPKEGSADLGDLVTFELSAKLDGEYVLGTPITRMLEIGKGLHIDELRAPLAGLDDALVGVATDETKEFELTIADDVASDALRGKVLACSVTLKELKRVILPDLDDEFAKDLGEFEDLGQLRARIRERLVNHKQNQARRELENALTNRLIEQNSFDVPPSLVAKQENYLRRQKQVQLMMAGVDPRTNPELIEQMLTGVDREAEQQVRTLLLLEKLSEEQSIEVDEAAVETRIEQMAASGNQPLAKIRARYAEGTSERDSLEYSLRQELTLEWLLKRVVANWPADESEREPAASTAASSAEAAEPEAAPAATADADAASGRASE